MMQVGGGGRGKGGKPYPFCCEKRSLYLFLSHHSHPQRFQQLFPKRDVESVIGIGLKKWQLGKTKTQKPVHKLKRHQVEI